MVKIIAECGVNHDGDVNKAIALCKAAKEAGADIAKFQIFQPELFREGSSARELLTPLSMSTANWQSIARRCEEIGIEFCATPDSIKDLDICIKCGVKRIKIGSGSLLYDPLVDACFDTGLPILLSTGMADGFEINRVVRRQFARRTTKSHGMAGDMPWTDVNIDRLNHLTLMHCVSLYPCPPALANVSAVQIMASILETSWPDKLCAVGYSDHTMGPAASIAAVALGATVIEKHFTCSQGKSGPDHHMSMSPAEFGSMVRDIHRTTRLLGDGLKEPSDREKEMIPRVRKDAEGFQPGI